NSFHNLCDGLVVCHAICTIRALQYITANLSMYPYKYALLINDTLHTIDRFQFMCASFVHSNVQSTPTSLWLANQLGLCSPTKEFTTQMHWERNTILGFQQLLCAKYHGNIHKL